MISGFYIPKKVKGVMNQQQEGVEEDEEAMKNESQQ
jgi:hypothetical protein